MIGNDPTAVEILRSALSMHRTYYISIRSYVKDSLLDTTGKYGILVITRMPECQNSIGAGILTPMTATVDVLFNDLTPMPDPWGRS